MRILFCIDSLSGGGAEKLLLRYIHILTEHYNCDITLFVISGYGALMSSIPGNIRCYVGDALTDEEATAFNHLTFDLEIGFLEGRAVKFIALRNTTSIKVGWIHTDMLNNNWCRNYYNDGMQEFMYNAMDFIVCINEYCARQCISAFPDLKGKVLVCNNVLDFSLLDHVKRKQNNPYNIKLCFAGRLVKEKHPEVAITAVKYLLDWGYAVYLNVLGDGYLYDNLCTLTMRLGIENNVQLLGYMENPYNIIAKSDLLVSVSDIEGGALNIAEAYYLGVPIVASHSGGADDFAKHFGGVLFTDISPSNLANSIAYLFKNNRVKYGHLESQIQPKKIKEHFSKNKLIATFDSWLSTLRSKDKNA